MDVVTKARPVVLVSILVFALSLAFCYATGVRKLTAPTPEGASPPGYDFGWMYAAGHCWLEGKNPYRGATFAPVLRRTVPENVVRTYSPVEIQTGTAYPPTGLPAFAVAALFPWKSALMFWWTLITAGVCTILFAAMDMIVPHWRIENKLLFVAAMLQSRIIHLNSYRGQASIPAFALVILGVWLIHRRKPVAGGVSLAASMLKFPLTLPVVAFYLLRREYRAVATTMIATCALLVVCLAPVGGLAALRSYSVTTKHFFARGSVNDTSASNPAHTGIDNVDVLLYNLAGNHDRVVLALRLALLVGLAIALLRPAIRSREDTPGFWLTWCAWNLTGYLFLYHRPYDGMVLWPVMITLMECYRTRSGPRALSAAGVTLLAVPIFVLSIQSVDIASNRLLAHAGPLAVLAPARVWLLCAVLAALVRLRYSGARMDAPVDLPARAIVAGRTESQIETSESGLESTAS